MKRMYATIWAMLLIAGLLLSTPPGNPGPDPGGPYSGIESARIDFKATVDDPALIFFRWDLDGDGTWDTDWRLAVDMVDEISKVYGDDFHGDILVDFWDGVATKTILVDGERVIVPVTETYPARLDIYNYAPMLFLEGADMVEEGTPIEFRAYAEDIGSDDLIFTWEWGDGSSESATFYNNGIGPDPAHSIDVSPISVTEDRSHTYAVAGTYEVTVTVTDDDGGSESITKSLEVVGKKASIDELIDYVKEQPIPKGTQTSLLAHLNAAKKFILKGEESKAAHELEVFVHHSGIYGENDKLTPEQTSYVLTCANEIIDMLL